MSLNSPSGAPLQVDPEVLRRQQMGGLQDKIIKGNMDAALATATGDRKGLDTILKRNEGELRIGFLKKVTEMNREVINGIEDKDGTMKGGLKDAMPNEFRQDTISTRLKLIMLSLTAQMPANGNAPDPEAKRYLQFKQFGDKDTNDVKPHLYHVNMFTVTDDRHFLSQLAQTYPQHAQWLNSLDACLQRFESADPNRAIAHRQWVNTPERPSTQAINHMGRLGIAVVATAFGAVMGIVSLATRKFSVTPFLYFGVAVLAARPDLLTTMFSPKEQRLLTEAAGILNDPTFTAQLCPAYNIQGPAWAGMIETLMKNERGVATKIIKDIDAGNLDSENITNLVGPKEAKDPAAPADPRIAQSPKAAMRNMIEKKDGVDFKHLVRMLHNVWNTDARQLVIDYVRDGTWKQAHQMQQQVAMR